MKTLALVLAAATATPAAAHVLVVDAAGGGHYTTLQAAANAAVDGDVLLVRAGIYTGELVIDGKSIDVVAEGGTGEVRVQNTLRIRGIPPQGAVTLSGLHIGDPTGGNDGVRIHDALGSVRLADCDVVGADTYGFDPDVSGAGVLVHGSPSVSLVRCSVQGGVLRSLGSCLFEPAGAGLAVSDSVVEVHAGSIRGGHPRISPAKLGGNGGDGIRLRSGSILRAYGASIRGGDGGDGDSFFFCGCGLGGVGVVTDGTSSASVRGGTIAGGAGGVFDPVFGNVTICDEGAVSEGAVVQSSGPERAIDVDRVVTTGGAIQGVIRGVAGESVFVAISSVHALQPYPALGGTLTVGSPYFVRALPLGQIPPWGELPFGDNVAGFAPGFGAVTLTMQPVMSGPSGRWLGLPDVVVVLESGF